jgi:hypothetical protein
MSTPVYTFVVRCLGTGIVNYIFIRCENEHVEMSSKVGMESFTGCAAFHRTFSKICDVEALWKYRGSGCRLKADKCHTPVRIPDATRLLQILR